MPDFKNRARLDGVTCTKVSKLAILVQHGHGQTYTSWWIPISQIDDESEVWKEGDEGELVVSEWIAIQKDLPVS